jgi:WD40 repeat protein
VPVFTVSWDELIPEGERCQGMRAALLCFADTSRRAGGVNPLFWFYTRGVSPPLALLQELSMRLLRSLLAVLLLTAALQAQPKPPAFPPLNLGVAKLSQTANLDAPATSLAFDDSKGILVVGAEDHLVRVWTRTEGKDLLASDAKVQVLRGHSSPVTAVAGGGGLFASAGSDGKVLIWKLPDDKPARTLTTGAPVRALALSADGKTLASAGDDGSVQLFDPTSGNLLRKLTGPTDWLLAVAFSGDGKTVLAGGNDGKLWAWEAASGKKLFDVLAQAPVPPKTEVTVNVVSALTFSPDGKQITLGGSDGKLYQFQPDGKFLRALPGHTSTITALVYHPDNQALASASKDRSIRFWNPTNGQMLKALEGHTAWVEGAAFLDKGTRLVSAGADRTVRVWELTNPPPPMPKKK